MRKYSFFIIISIFIVLVTLLGGCKKSEEDNLKPFRDKSASELFQTGETQLVKHKWDKAILSLNALDTLYPYGPYAEQGLIDVIYAYYKKGDIASGLAMTDRYIRLYPRGQHADYVYYMKGRMSEEKNLSWLQTTLKFDPAQHDLSAEKESFNAYKQLVIFFPQSQYVPDASIRMIRIRNLLAHKEIMLASYYLRRQAYVAAANRASLVVEHFNGSPQVINALVIMVKAYRGAGLHKMANDTLKILQADYPDSPELKKLIKK